MIVSRILRCCEPEWIAHRWARSDSCTATIKRDRAKFSLEGTTGPFVVVDLDKISCIAQQRRCDFVLIVDDEMSSNSKAVLIELTSGRKDMKTLRSQLESSAKLAVRKARGIRNITFHPVCVGRVHDVRYARGKQGQVVINGKRVKIEFIKSGGKIADAI